MGLIRNSENRNISVASVNGYTKEKVLKAKEYLKEIGNDRRNFSVERLVEMYNDIKNTNEKAVGCKPCAATKYYNGIQNYAYFGELTLINNGKATKDELDLDKAREMETVEEEIKPKMDIKERMAKARAARKAKKKE